MIGTAHLEPKCGTWKKHWIKYARKKWPKKCQRRWCRNRAKVGAHITIGESSRKYIFPLCNKCNLTRESGMKPIVNSVAVSIRKEDNVN